MLKFFFDNKFNKIYLGFLISVIAIFFYLRPLNSPWHPFIAGDGLGYYSYLPAVFIYHDGELNFKWFNKTYNQNYVYSSFQNPEDNLLVQKGDKRINKYYQGLSFVWFPFFASAHLFAKVFSIQADGFSWPYQYAIGLASLVFLLIALIYLRKILQVIFHDELAAVVIPMFIFYGTHLFNISIFANSMSHIYSLAFACMSVFYFLKIFEEDNSKNHFILFLLFFVLGVCIRPLNILILLALPLLAPKKLSFNFIKLKINFRSIICITILLLLLFYQCTLNFIQTGNLFSYTYTNETFHFLNSKFLDALYSFHIGLLWYMPFAFFVLVLGIFNRNYLWMSIYFLSILFLYSSWWYWPIVKRAMIDYYWVISIVAASIFVSIKKKNLKIAFIFFSMLFVGCYQLKNYQIQKGILSEFSTYKEVYWRNFFRIKKAQQYFIQPQTILEKEEYFTSFENNQTAQNTNNNRPFNGGSSMVLDSAQNFKELKSFAFPKIFAKKGIKKIRFSMMINCGKQIKLIHLFIQFKDSANKSILDVPFYLNQEDIFANEWDFKEFGYELDNQNQMDSTRVKSITVSVWNVENKNKIYIDALKTEFILCNTSFETIDK